jgi:hypothetical protein
MKEFILAMNVKYYLELGLGNGFNFKTIKDYVEYSVGVDINRVSIIGNNYKFYHMTSDEFFKQNEMMFDFIFIDANHKFENVLSDFLNSIKFLNKNGTIAIHDTDPESIELCNDEFCSDSWKINDFLKHNFKYDYEIIILPFFETGLTLVRRSGETRFNKILENIGGG